MTTYHKRFECLECGRSKIFATPPENVAWTCQPTDRGFYTCEKCLQNSDNQTIKQAEGDL